MLYVLSFERFVRNAAGKPDSYSIPTWLSRRWCSEEDCTKIYLKIYSMGGMFYFWVSCSGGSCIQGNKTFVSFKWLLPYKSQSVELVWCYNIKRGWLWVKDLKGGGRGLYYVTIPEFSVGAKKQQDSQYSLPLDWQLSEGPASDYNLRQNPPNKTQMCCTFYRCFHSAIIFAIAVLRGPLLG